MDDLILYRNEWYEVKQYDNNSVLLKDDLGNIFEVLDKDIEAPAFYA